MTKPPIIRFKDAQIELAHGAGGKASRRLVEGLIAPILGNPTLEDAALLSLSGTSLAFTADSFVVKPLRFPGGSIGELAVNGTVNDLAVSGARPLALLSTLILEAGLSVQTLQGELEAIQRTAQTAGVQVVGGDTKVVEHGKADGLYISTSGIGLVDSRVSLSATSVRPGDRVLLSGPIGDHGITILLARGELDLEADLKSDTRSVWPLVEALIQSAAPGLRWMRDPTRGGVATALNELAKEARLAFKLYEDRVPIRDEVRGACEILGLDPLHIANEGQFIAIVAPEYIEVALEAVRAVPGGEEATLIGEAVENPAGVVYTVSGYGSSRVVDMLVGDPLPRIC
ncbi:hydrogenase expression/formation protein HypE [uncultured Meiothermus sp.]|jgi:hydrogenase expression/formation protein HypE|uniref:hydrogenase expression/formation protein HypE n=1 Tax=uncultured Meiothermus sp. TaxID=157471 RepID=UPI002638AC89|nr:hydrogenase expression/formation protein HypE [uncultured Meiothermus sp.]